MLSVTIVGNCAFPAAASRAFLGTLIFVGTMFWKKNVLFREHLHHFLDLSRFLAGTVLELFSGTVLEQLLIIQELLILAGK